MMEIMIEGLLEWGYLNIPEHVSSKKELIELLEDRKKDLELLISQLKEKTDLSVDLVITPSKEYPEGVIKELK